MQTNLGETICKYRQIQNMTQEEFEENIKRRVRNLSL